jgi:hypothetical protein
MILVDDDLFLHELEEALTIPIWMNSRDVLAVGSIGLDLVFNLLVPDEFLQVVNDSDVVDVHTIGAHEGIQLRLITLDQSFVIVTILI